MENRIIQGYVDAAEELIPRYLAVPSDDLFAPMIPLLPEAGRLIDIGAGVGQDAAWFADKGFDVLAVEPVAAFRDAGAAHFPNERIEWLDDTLPDLSRVLALKTAFDVVICSAVWQHLDTTQREKAMRTIRALTARPGVLILSLRHGPGAPGRPTFDNPVQEAIDLAQENGFQVEIRRGRESLQEWNRSAGVTWTWLGFTLPA